MLRTDTVEYDARTRLVIATAQQSYPPEGHDTRGVYEADQAGTQTPDGRRFQAEAREALAKRSSQGRFIDIAASKDRSWEPVGRLAG